MSEKQPILGVFGGTALFNIPFPVTDEYWLETPFGQPSSVVKHISLPDGRTLLLMDRHGPGHVFSPSSINYRANVWAMKKLGVTHLLSLSAVGSLNEGIVPGKTLVIPDQFFDHTKGIRQHTFFKGNNDIVAHVSLADPVCPNFSASLQNICRELTQEKNCSCSWHAGGTYVVIEGPNFSTRAESEFFKNVLRADVVGMTALPEARLAREAGLCFSVLCFPADYDSWRRGEKGVDADEVVAGLEPFHYIPEKVIPRLAKAIKLDQCGCADSLKGFAIHSDLAFVPAEQKVKYDLFI